MTAVSTFTIPPSQNTAPVFQFHCLYTHDLRKKQKRYHDGVLRFHTFNKRIMVYDQMGNYSGDLHWQQGQGIGEGDEITLNNGVLVTVGEALTTLETDLAPILDRKTNQRPAGTPKRLEKSKDNRMGLKSQSLTLKPSSRQTLTQSRHRALSAILRKPDGAEGTPTKATTLAKSQPRVREEKENVEEITRPTKRPKTTHTATPLAIENKSMANATNIALPKDRLRDARLTVPSLLKSASAATPCPRAVVDEIVDLVSDIEDRPSSGVTLPETSPTRVVRLGGKPQTLSTSHNSKNGTTPLLKSSRQYPIVRDAPPSSPPVSAANVISDVERFLGQSARKLSTPKENKNASGLTTKPQTKPLRIPTGKVKKVLLCENQSKEHLSNPMSDDWDKLLAKASTRGKDILNDSEITDPSVHKQRPPKNPRIKAPQDEDCSTKPKSLAALDQQMLRGNPSYAASKPKNPLLTSGCLQQDIRKANSDIDEATVAPCDNPPTEPPAKSIRNKQTTTRQKRSRKVQNATKPRTDQSLEKITMVSHPQAEDTDTGPWSTEAFDLFDWRPPDRAGRAGSDSNNAKGDTTRTV